MDDRDFHESSFYKRALARRGCVLTPQEIDGSGVSSVVVSCSIAAFKGGRYAPAAGELNHNFDYLRHRSNVLLPYLR